jgi:hypothetical protein
MDRPLTDGTEAEAEVEASGCSCGDPYAHLPAGLRPKPAAQSDGLRQVTCPLCALIYWTNRPTDLCIRCE